MLFELHLMIAEGERISLFRLAARSLLDYSNAYRHLSRMERQGLVAVVRFGSGRPLGITPLASQIPFEGVFEQC